MPVPNNITTSRAVSIGRHSRQTGVNVETIRYYERIGILPQPPRTAGGRRIFDGTAARRLIFIRRCRELGFGLDDVRAMLSLVDRDEADCAAIRELTEGHLMEVRSKLAVLRRMERVLATMVKQCRSGMVPDCPIVETLSSGR
jgi:MerR family mercuric resistance operon transcriptional regulator